MSRRWILLMGAISFSAVAQQPPERELAPHASPPVEMPASMSDLRFVEDGDDLLVQVMIEGPANRQVVLTDHALEDGWPQWDEPPIGAKKTRRPQQVHLRYLVLINQDLPGFTTGGLMTPPTPPAVRLAGRQHVVWRLRDFRKLQIRREDVIVRITGTEFNVSSDKLREALPKFQETIDRAERERSKRDKGEAP